MDLGACTHTHTHTHTHTYTYTHTHTHTLHFLLNLCYHMPKQQSLCIILIFTKHLLRYLNRKLVSYEFLPSSLSFPFFLSARFRFTGFRMLSSCIVGVRIRRISTISSPCSFVIAVRIVVRTISSMFRSLLSNGGRHY